MKYSNLFVLFLALLMLNCQPEKKSSTVTGSNNYEDLLKLFQDWRSFEKPPILNGAPDYTAKTFEKRWPEFKNLQDQLLAMDTAGWPIAQQVDWTIVWAEMNGYDFNQHILKPWVRDPAFYKTLWMERSDVPAHEGPTHHMITELWTYTFPLSVDEKGKLLSDLSIIPSLNEQAKLNLIGNAKDLWIAGIRDIKAQGEDLKMVLGKPAVQQDSELISAIESALASTQDFAAWLDSQAPSKTGPSGVGKEQYTWYQQNVHLLPFTWEDEVILLKRELSRAWSALKLEEHRNRELPKLIEADSPESFRDRAEKGAHSLLEFLEQKEILTVKDYFAEALMEHQGEFVPKEKRNFFSITAHYDPRPLMSHSYHWFELARMKYEPNEREIRRGPLLYNIFDNRNEGMATAVEEMFMQAGLYDDSPRSREIVYIMIAQRAARGLGSLYAHANELTMAEAGYIHSEYTPRGWMKNEKELLQFEQHLYLRQPGYGTSYITGKFLIEKTLGDFARITEAKNETFKLSDFFDQMSSIGNIPVTLGHWQLTGIHEKAGEISF